MAKMKKSGKEPGKIREEREGDAEKAEVNRSDSKIEMVQDHEEFYNIPGDERMEVKRDPFPGQL